MQKKYSTSGYHPIKKFKVILKGLYFAVITDFTVRSKCDAYFRKKTTLT